MVVDGVAGPALSSCLKFTFSQASRHFAYIAWIDQKSVVFKVDVPTRAGVSC